MARFVLNKLRATLKCFGVWHETNYVDKRGAKFIILLMSKKLKTMTAARARETLSKLMPKRTFGITVNEWYHYYAGYYSGAQPYNSTNLSISVHPGFTGEPCDRFDQEVPTVDFSLIVARIVAAKELSEQA